MEADGILFVYNTHGSFAYKSKIQSKNFVIFIDGMGGSILSIPYFNILKAYCDENNIVLVYPQLRSHPNYTIFDIETDIEDINDLVNMIDGDIVFIGHSTGCQDCLLYMEAHKSNKVKGVILQGPVSDIESNKDPNIKMHIKKAQSSEKYYVYGNQIWLKDRFLSCYESKKREDLFSSYLYDCDFLKWRQFGPILSVLSLKDEFCESNLSDKFKLMGKVVTLKNANHSISSEKDAREFIEAVNSFLKSIKFI